MNEYETEKSTGPANQNGETHADNTAEEAQTADGTPGEGDEEILLEVDLEKENAELKDKLLRALADVENMRQRTARELEDSRRYAVTNFARNLLEVADNLRRAIDSAPKGDDQSEAVRNLLTGVEMTERSLLGVFEKASIKRVSPEAGEKFDHKIHQAMFEVPTDKMAPGHIAEIMQSGYVIADRLLRPAMVGVSKKLPEQPTDQTSAPGQKIDTEA